MYSVQNTTMLCVTGTLVSVEQDDPIVVTVVVVCDGDGDGVMVVFVFVIVVIIIVVFIVVAHIITTERVQVEWFHLTSFPHIDTQLIHR